MGLWSNSHWSGRGVKVRGMNLPPGSSNERRHLPRHIRDGEHEMLHEVAEGAASATPGRRWRLLVYVVLIAAVVAGLWFYNGTRA